MGTGRCPVIDNNPSAASPTGTARGLPPSLPLFSGGDPDQSAANLLAGGSSQDPHTQAGKDAQANPLTEGQVASLHCNGPHNPAGLLPPRLVKRILNLEYVEMSDISPDEVQTATPGMPPPPPKKPIQDISLWVEKFATMASVLVSRFPEKAPELFAYLTSVVKAERNFEGNRWVVYDRCYRREALANKSLDWSLPNTRLYNEAFTGHARSIPRCGHCLQEDHSSATCPRNPSRGWFPWLMDPSMVSSAPSPQPRSNERCHRYNDGRCHNTSNTCKYVHKCRECGGPHPAFHCTRGGQRRARSRSPTQHRQYQRNPPPSGRRQ